MSLKFEIILSKQRKLDKETGEEKKISTERTTTAILHDSSFNTSMVVLLPTTQMTNDNHERY